MKKFTMMFEAKRISTGNSASNQLFIDKGKNETFTLTNPNPERVEAATIAD